MTLETHLCFSQMRKAMPPSGLKLLKASRKASALLKPTVSQIMADTLGIARHIRTLQPVHPRSCPCERRTVGDVPLRVLLPPAAIPMYGNFDHSSEDCYSSGSDGQFTCSDAPKRRKDKKAKKEDPLVEFLNSSKVSLKVEVSILTRELTESRMKAEQYETKYDDLVNCP